MRGRRAVVTGGGGSIGTAVCEMLSWMGAVVLAIDSSEMAVYSLLEQRLPGVDARLGCVRDNWRMLCLMNGFKPFAVFHAAALKHVSLCERDQDETGATNVDGTANVARVAEAVKAKVMVLVSTDKAVEPSCAMGRSKADAERIMARMDGSNTRFVAARLVNVIGSNGSVVPKFARQTMTGGPVTVTHRSAARYLMTEREAAELTIAAAGLALKGEGQMFIMDVGEPVLIENLACRMMRMLDREVKIEATGLRPGEKMREKMMRDDEMSLTTTIPSIIEIRPRIMPMKNG